VKALKWLLIVLAGLIVLAALFYAEEDWRGKRAWEKFKHEWEAKGERFDLTGLIPPPVPDDQNFAMTPVVFTSYGSILTRDGKFIPDKDRDTNFINRLSMSVVLDDESPTNGTGNWLTVKTSDLKVWQNYYRTLAATNDEFPVTAQPQTPAADVLLALSKYDSTVEELRQAGQLPYSRFPLDYDSKNPAIILLPHLANLRGCTRVLQLRAIAELQCSQNEKALNDIKLMFRLSESIRTEPILISQLVRIAILQIALQPVWEGLASHKWSDEQLVILDTELAKLDFLADYEFSMRAERAFDIGIIEYLRHQNSIQEVRKISQMSRDESGIKPRDVIIFYLGPSGWIDQRELRISRFFAHWYFPVANVDLQIFSPAAVRNADETLRVETGNFQRGDFLERLLLPALGAAAKKFAFAQNSVNLARMACALERYRLAHGEYPETLDALVPQFIEKLPHDIIGGQPSQGSGSASQPLHYRRTADGKFLLYSVGWNETDDGGQVVLKEDGTVDRDKGDWVWQYPTK